ncbi:MAG TPA: four helix bundle protein [archaeon]|nr:four helix bundle protein [archaeon]
MGEKIKTYKDLRVYQNAMEAAMKIFELTREFPPEEKYSMVDQIRKSSRSVCANLAEAWRKRRYQAAFVSKLSDAESEACETQVWLEFAQRCGYLKSDRGLELEAAYDQITAQIVKMIQEADKWLIR